MRVMVQDRNINQIYLNYSSMIGILRIYKKLQDFDPQLFNPSASHIFVAASSLVARFYAAFPNF
jgi:hypothetical protein